MVTADPDLSVIVFARRPRLGRVKQRLAVRLGAARALRIYTALLLRTLATLEAVPGLRRVIMPAAREDLSWFRRRYQRRGWQVVAQSGGDLGQRMSAAFAHELPYSQRVLLVGSDIADFCAADIDSAAAALRSGKDVVFGPALDGGYWLVGMSQQHAECFAAISWSSSAVLSQSLQRLSLHQLSSTLIQPRSDIDYARDLPKWRPRRIQRRRARSRSSRAT